LGVKDYVGSAVTIKQSSSFEIKELYKTMKAWLSDRGYGVSEPSYTEKPLPDGHKKTSFFWSCSKKMDPYANLVIEINFDAEAKDVTVEKDERTHTVQEGDVKITFSAYISKDIEDEWALREKSGVQRFLRELYDKFFKKTKFDDYEDKLKKDLDAIIYDTKTYLRMHRFD